MVRVVTDRQEIQNLHTQFIDKLGAFFNERIHCRIGYPGGSFEENVLYSAALNLWVGSFDRDNRFWNGFGRGRPIDSNSNSISGEINFPVEGINRRIAGAFGRDVNGNIIILHRGKIGGGRLGVGKSYFKDNFRGDFLVVTDGDRETEFCLVGELSSEHFPQQILNFISEISRVKGLEGEGVVPDFRELTDFNYTDEHAGQTVTERTGPIIIDRTHGIVVNALARQLENSGNQIGNDRNRDLFIHAQGQIRTLFEVKTSSSTQCLYSAVGQLLIYSIPISNPVKLVAVFPDKLNKKVTNKLSSIGIDILYYEWDNDAIVFTDIDNVL